MKVINPVTIADGGNGFSRASSKWVIGTNGLLQSVAANVPAWQYDPANLAAAPVLSLEGAGQNLLWSSADFTQAAWGKVRCSVVGNAGMAPDGSNTACRVVEDGTQGAYREVYQGYFKSGSAVYSMSGFFKAGARTQIQLLLDSSVPGSGVRAVFDLTTGATISMQTSGGFKLGSSGITALFGGWYWCWLSGMSDVDSRLFAEYMPCVNGQPVYNGDGSSDWYMWGCQLELGVPSSYMPSTNAVLGSRAADVVAGSGLIYGPAETEALAWRAATTYHSDDIVTDGHAVWQCKLTNTGDQPSTSTAFPPNWKKLSVTNRWAPFDGISGTQQTGNAINLIFRPGQIDSIGLANLAGDSLSLAMYQGYAMVYKNVLPLVNQDGVLDAWQYLFDPFSVVTSVSLTDLPPFTDTTLCIAITGSAGCALGNVVAGTAFDLGATSWGVVGELVTYSKFVDDGFGNQEVAKGATTIKVSAELVQPQLAYDDAFRVAQALDAVPTMFIGTPLDKTLQSLNQFGVLKTYRATADNPTDGRVSIEIGGFT